METTLSYFVSNLVLPPMALVALTLLGVALWRSRPRLAVGLIVVSQLGIVACSLPVVAVALLRTLEPPPVTPEALRRAQAIVILAAGRNYGAVEWGGETVNALTLQRLRYGAHVARTSGLPVYVTGGMPGGSGRHPEGKLMAEVLQREFGVAVKWIDNAASTTRESALMAQRDLRPLGIQRVALVTSAFHMPRSRQVFEAAGFTVIAAPTGYYAQNPFSASQLVPTLTSLWLTHFALREWVAQGWYRARDAIDRYNKE